MLVSVADAVSLTWTLPSASFQVSCAAVRTPSNAASHEAYAFVPVAAAPGVGTSVFMLRIALSVLTYDSAIFRWTVLVPAGKET